MNENVADRYGKVNPILRRVMKEIYGRRRHLPRTPLTSVRIETIEEEAFAEVWFMTPGCSHDAHGGCTMCNYGKGHIITENEILSHLSASVSSLPKNLKELILTPSGSMLDDEEVSPALRENIFQLLSDMHIREFAVETRAETVTAEKLRQLKTMVHASQITVEMGVESTNEWVLRNCVNKNLCMADIKEALQVIHGEEMLACANVGVGIPMLSERASIELARLSLHELLDMGFDSAVLFPYHVKPGTLSAWLMENGMYQCCSLWALPEVLSDFSGEELERIQISWYRNNYKDPSKIIASPRTCSLCGEKVLALLDDYRNHPGGKTLLALNSYSCACREKWKEEVDAQEKTVQSEMFYAIYKRMAAEYRIPKEILDEEMRHMLLTADGKGE